MSIIKTANTHQTSLLVSEQIPGFVRSDHPVFVEFIETYYEFLSQANTGVLTSDGASFYMGAEYATKIIPDDVNIISKRNTLIHLNDVDSTTQIIDDTDIIRSKKHRASLEPSSS